VCANAVRGNQTTKEPTVNPNSHVTTMSRMSFLLKLVQMQ